MGSVTMFANTFNRILSLSPLPASLSSTPVQQSRPGKRQVPKKGKAPIPCPGRGSKLHYHIKGGRDIAKLSKLPRFNIRIFFRPLSLSTLLPVLISDRQTSPFSLSLSLSKIEEIGSVTQYRGYIIIDTISKFEEKNYHPADDNFILEYF